MLTNAAALREIRKFRQEEKRHTDPATPQIPISLVRRWNVESKSSWIGMIESRVFSWLPSLEAVDRVDLFDRLQAGARWKAIRDRVHQEHGVTFLSANRFGIEHNIDMAILLTASEPVSAGFISDLKRVANEASAANLNIGVYAFQEAQIKHSKF